MNTERSLILRTLTHHDNDAFSSLVKKHQSKIRAFLFRLCKQYDVADDLAQETFITAFRKLDTYKGTGDFCGWLFRIAYNNFLLHCRSVNRRTEVTADFIKQSEVLAERYESISSEQIDLEQAMSQLNSDEIASISLCHSFGYSHQEVSNILKMPLGTVKSNINRGKTKLRKILNSEAQQISLESARDR